MSGQYFEPTTVEEAVAIGAEHGENARFVAGGTDLVVLARKLRRPLPPVLIALHRMTELAEVGSPADGSLSIGAGVSHDRLSRDPLVTGPYTAVSDGSALVGSPATRHVGTLGGNLCNASPANDTGSALLVLDASVETASSAGRSALSLADFFVAPGRTSLAAGELLVKVNLPAPPAGVFGSAYVRLDYRRAMEIAVVGAAASVLLDGDGVIERASVSLTAVAPTCIVVPAVGEHLRGQPALPETLREAAQLTREAASPIDDVRAPANYRAATVPVLVQRALSCAVRRARGESIAVPASLSVTFNAAGEAA
jgi:CO/xanthine dehydrogenase FAD-binding subunit